MQFEVTDPVSKQTLILEGDSPPSEEELEQIFSQFDPAAPEITVKGTAEAALVGGLSTLGQSAGGLLGSVDAAVRGNEAGVNTLNAVSDFFTPEPSDNALEVFRAIASIPIVERMGQEIESQREGGAMIAGLAARILGADDPALFETAASMRPDVMMALLGLTGIRGLGVPRGVKGVKGVSDDDALNLANQGLTVDDLSDSGIAKLQEKAAAQAKEGFDQNLQGQIPEIQIRQEDGSLNPDIIERLELLKRQEVEPDNALLTQDTDLFRIRQDSQKQTGKVGEKVAAEDEALQIALQKRIDGTGSTADNLTIANNAVFEPIDNFRIQQEGKISEAYRKAREISSNGAKIELDQTLGALNKLRGPKLNKPVVSQLESTLKNLGISDGKVSRPVSVDEAELIRQELNTLFDSLDGQGKRVLSQFKDAIDNDVSAAVGEDVFAEARKLKSDFESKLRRAKRDRRDKTKTGFVEKIVNNNIKESQILDKVKTGTREDISELKNFLSDIPDGDQAWNEIRGQILRESLENATKGSGKNAKGAPVFNGVAFERTFANLKKKQTFDVLFDETDQQVISDIIDISKLRTPQGQVFAGSGPSALAIFTGISKALEKIPFAKQFGLVEFVSSVIDEKRLLDTREIEQLVN